jgi:hypothetical protein
MKEFLGIDSLDKDCRVKNERVRSNLIVSAHNLSIIY